MNSHRYIITKPVKDGYQWVDIADTQNNNESIASFHVVRFPDAQAVAWSLAECMNNGVDIDIPQFG